MMDALIVFKVLPGFLLAFPIFWITIVFLVSRLGGWARLASQFSADNPPSGDKFSWHSAHLNRLGRYGNCVTVTVSSQGVHMQTILIFRFGHKAIFLPWGAISNMTRSTFLGFSRTKLTVDDDNGQRTSWITLYGNSLAKGLQRHAPTRLKVHAL